MEIENIFSKRLSVAFLAILCTILWGSAFPTVKTGFQMLGITEQDTWHKLIYAGYRFFLAGLIIFAFALVTRQNIRITKPIIKPIIVMGLVNTTLQYFFFYIGLSHTTGINASIFNSVLSFFSIIMAHLFLENDKINFDKTIGLILGFAGILTVNFSPGLLAIRFNPIGDGFIMLAMLSGAIGFIYLKKITKDIAIIPFTAYQMMLGSIFLILPSSLKVGIMPFDFNLGSAALLLYLAVLSAMAFSLWNTLIKYNPVGQISFYLFLIPVFGTVLSAIFINSEHISIYTMISLVLVSAGLIIVNSGKSFFRAKAEHEMAQ